MNRLAHLVGCIAPLTLLAAGVAAGSDGDTATIAASGTATVLPAPSVLRGEWHIQAQGKTVEEAMERLKERRAAAVEKLRACKADAESIRAGNPSVLRVGYATPTTPVTPSYVVPGPTYGPPGGGYSPPPPTLVPPGGGYSPPPPTYGPPAGLTPVPSPPPVLPPSSPVRPTPAAPREPTPEPATRGTTAVPSALYAIAADRPAAVPVSDVTPAVPPPATVLPTYPAPGPAAPPSVYPPSAPATPAPAPGGYSPAPYAGPFIPRPMPAPPKVASQRLTAEWRLEGTSHERIAAAEAIRAKVSDAARTWPAPSVRQSAEEQEVLEEQAGLAAPTTFSAPPDGDPRFVYVARLSDAERREALGRAMAQAKAMAADTAAAASVKLGRMRLVSTTISANTASFDSGAVYLPSPPDSPPLLPADSDYEAVSEQPESLGFRVRVFSQFATE